MTSKSAPQIGEKSFDISGMSFPEAIAFMQNEANDLKVQVPGESELKELYNASMGGIPQVMHIFMGMMKSQGLTTEEVINSAPRNPDYKMLASYYEEKLKK